MTRLDNCRHEVARWKKNDLLNGKENIMELQRRELWRQFNRMTIEHMRTSWRFLGRYRRRIKMKKIIGKKRAGTFGIRLGIQIQNSIIF